MNRLEALMSFFESEPNDPFNSYAIALEYRSLNQLDQAIDWLQNLRMKFPDYVPTYYQLAKLLETVNIEEAEQIYHAGLDVAKKSNDNHAYRELKAALQMMLDDLI